MKYDKEAAMEQVSNLCDAMHHSVNDPHLNIAQAKEIERLTAEVRLESEKETQEIVRSRK